ncbi:endo alpha-1,4 polygalactosaminidase [Paeniglutamicibacter antarcticus]|uniref:Endo alpha-1,4 polygalactosaminidase n=2 Tax=Paeniglutamicibacter antarcticus TaxID=494023 RepID=A0ABP9TIB2_9MICC
MLVAALLAFTACSSGGAVDPESTWWSPEQGQSWQMQLAGGLDTDVEAQIYDVDSIDTSLKDLEEAHGKGAHLVCYFNAGAWEEWRGDATGFDQVLLGNELGGWPGERWLDVRRQDALLPIMAKRMDACKERGFDAVDPDNVDGYSNDSGFGLSEDDQLAYIRALAQLAHERGLGFGLKNAVELVGGLVDEIDFAVNEQCHEYDECDVYDRLLAAGKAVVVLEYAMDPKQVCGAVPRGIEVLFKPLELGAERSTC